MPPPKNICPAQASAARRNNAPLRLSLPDFSGRRLSLPDTAAAWEVFGVGANALVLGLGPFRPENLPVGQECAHLYWLEAPETLRGMQALLAAAAETSQAAAVPSDDAGVAVPPVAAVPPDDAAPSEASRCTAVGPEQVVSLALQCRIFFYRPGLRLAPKFWGPILGRVDAALAAEAAASARGPQVPETVGKPGATVFSAPSVSAAGNGRQQGGTLVPGTQMQLLHRELCDALPAAGLGPVTEVAPDRFAPEGSVGNGTANGSTGGSTGRSVGLAQAAALLEEQRPALLLSVNLRGLDAEGRIFHCCRALGTTVVVWCVDNPWHLLSNVRLPWWRDAVLCVTDPTFIPGLKATGAQRVFHLPLAVAPHAWREPLPPDVPTDGPLFVGRSAFPGRERFFAAARVPEAAAAAAEALAVQAEASAVQSNPVAVRPDYHWWCAALKTELWPGQAARSAGLGAENCSRAGRARLVAAGLEAGLRVVGDDGWQALVPGLRPGQNLLPPVDYYTALPELYRRAEAVLDAVSLLLPGSLNQRHFDVWAAGGLLLSDAEVGLRLFPAELTRPILLRSPAAVASRLRALRADSDLGRQLRAGWREHLRAEHSYAHRLRRLRELLDM